MKSTLSRLTITLSILVLAACKAALDPEWTLFYTQAMGSETRVEWLSNVAVDSYGNVLVAGDTIRTGANRQQNALLVKHDTNGSLEWAAEYDFAQGQYRSDDNVTDMVVDLDGNTYLVGVQYIVEGEAQRYGSFLMKVDRWGDIEWAKSISAFEDARDIELKNGLLYVTGHTTQVYGLDGSLRLKIAHSEAKAWDIEVDDLGSIYVAGYAAVSKFNSQGGLVWRVDQPEGLSHQASLVVAADGRVVTAHNQSDQSTRVAAISSQGQPLWSKVYQPARQSNGLPGPALIKKDVRGDLVLLSSNVAGRRMVKLSDTGRELWQTSNSNGIVQDFTIGDDGAVYVVGGGTNEKFDRNGNFVAEATMNHGVESTTGSIAKSGDDIYIGYSALRNGTYNFFLAKYIDQ